MKDETCIVPSKFAHFVLRTSRFEEMKRWYQTVLGAKVQFGNEKVAFLTYHEEHHRLALISMPGLPDAGKTAGLDHVAYTYASMSDLLATYKRLKAAGIKPVWCINHGPTTSMYYRDPDGNRVEHQIDNFPTVEALNAWFHSSAFAKNPIGVEYDPDRLVEKFESGVPVQELVLQGSV